MASCSDCNGDNHRCSLDVCDVSSPFVSILKDVISSGVASIRGIGPADLQHLHKVWGSSGLLENALYARVLLRANECHWSASDMEVGALHLHCCCLVTDFSACRNL